jgi:ADP-ribose pyrophosphatase
MKWTLVDVRQETDHPYLNYFTLVYDVEKEDGHHTYEYRMASRHKKEDILPLTHKYDRPDGVLIPLYYVDPKTREVSVLLQKQFRPPIGRYVTSVPAGLMDPGDTDAFMTANREAKEEAGAIITDLELLSPAASTSSGLSDETNAVVLARIDHFTACDKEEFEDISPKLYSLEDVAKMLKDPAYFFASNIRLIMLYLLYRFQEKSC